MRILPFWFARGWYRNAMPDFIRALAASVLFATAGCATLPASVQRIESRALADTASTRLGRAIAPLAAANPGKSGIHALPNPRDAFAARVLLARAAERSLDLQYYIWHPDTTGGLLAEALWQAAERGVRVRLLLDDANTKGLDEVIAVLDAHPNIEVRLFNPFANRATRIADFLADFSRVNRRMHNKAFIADNQVAIVGGRNVGDEYYGAETPVVFADLDALAAGTVVPQVSAAFDVYWNSASAYPAASLIPPPAPESATQIRAAWRDEKGPQAERYGEALRTTPLVRQLLAGELPLEWTHAHVLHDDPAKVLHPPEMRELHMLPRLEEALGKPVRELNLVSPYFVPTKAGTEAILAIASRGVSIRILTNSLAATDVAPVHAGYSRYREALLRGGVRLYELKPSASDSGAKEHRERHGLGASSGAALHAKTFGVDRSRIFIGSFNFDPRSARLNTEMGILVESAALASQLSDGLDRELPRVAYEVVVADGRLQWVENSASGEVRHESEPGVGALRRLWVDFLSILPLEWLL
jgi:cardiolipin synthase C